VTCTEDAEIRPSLRGKASRCNPTPCLPFETDRSVIVILSVSVGSVPDTVIVTSQQKACIPCSGSRGGKASSQLCPPPLPLLLFSNCNPHHHLDASSSTCSSHLVTGPLPGNDVWPGENHHIVILRRQCCCCPNQRHPPRRHYPVDLAQ